MLRMTVFALVGLITAACGGTVVMMPLNPSTIEQDYSNNKKIEGIIVYRAIPMVEVDKFIQVNLPADPATKKDQPLDPAEKPGQPPDPTQKPGQTTVLSNHCIPVATRKIVSIADWEHPYRLHYNRGFLETYTFGATLNSDGILTAVNNQSTPDQGKTFQNLTSAASTAAATAAKSLEGPPTIPCTITPVFVGYEKLPKQAEIPPFDTLCKDPMKCR